MHFLKQKSFINFILSMLFSKKKKKKSSENIRTKFFFMKMGSPGQLPKKVETGTASPEKT